LLAVATERLQRVASRIPAPDEFAQPSHEGIEAIAGGYGNHAREAFPAGPART
jgi:hypothetical protein